MVQVEIALYDLLPPGKLSTTFYYLGVGIYHTSIRIPELQVEFAYGGIMPGSHAGRDPSTQTGIFALPSPADHRVTERLMPGLRFIRRIVVGDAFGENWVKNIKQKSESARPHSMHKPLPPLPETTSRNHRRRPRYKTNLSSSSSSGNLPLLPQSDASGYPEDQSFASMASTDEWGRKASSPPSASPTDRYSMISNSLMVSPASYDPPAGLPFRDDALSQDRICAWNNVAKSGTQDLQQNSMPFSTYPSGYRSHQIPTSASELTHILALIEDMKLEPEWRATRYHLLAKNCNSFTSELCYRLTGLRAPTFINRAAWLAQSLPCLVPDGWLDPPTAEELQEISSSSTKAGTGTNAETERPTSPLIAVPYLETSPMHVDVHYEGVQGR